jgi:hypothetical protein
MSPSTLPLMPASLAALTRLLVEHAAKTGTDIVPPTRELAAMTGRAACTVATQLDQLSDLGMVDLVSPGGRGRGNRCVWKLTEEAKGR